ncbi:MAG: hypothetical protein GY851_24100 [bacterium]|nr:hypothetical protein [bacterium]
MAAPGLHLCLMTFAWVVPFFSADLWAYHWEHGSLLGFVPYAVVAIMTVLAALGLASIEAYFKPGPTSREVCVWAVYCGTMLTSCGLTNDLVSEGAAEYMSGSSDSSFLMLAFPSMAFYALLLPIRAYVNRRKKPSATDADNVQEASADQE